MIGQSKHSVDFVSNCLGNKVSFVSGQFHLSDLMPYELGRRCGAQLRTALKEYQMLLAASLEAMNALDLSELDKFDALVGENACQIRAVWIAIIASKNLVPINELKEKIFKIKYRITWLLKEITISKLMSIGISLEELLLSEKLFVRLNLQDIFIIQCFILREAKSADYDKRQMDSFFIKERCDPKKLRKFGDISSTFAGNLVSKMRKSVAQISVQLVRESADTSQDQNLIRLLSDEFTLNHNSHLLCTPMFWTYKSILFAAKQEEIRFILQVKFVDRAGDGYEIIDEDWLFFDHLSSVNEGRNLTELKEVDRDKAACVVQGVVYLNQKTPAYKAEWRQNILKYKLDTVILSGAADHRQYPCQEGSEAIDLLQDHEYETFKSLARTEGFSLNNPTTFFIQHVYPLRTETLVSRASSTELKAIF